MICSIRSALSFLRMTPLPAAFAMMSIAGGTLVVQGAVVSAHNAWAREMPAGRNVTAVYLTLENTGAVTRLVVSGTTNVADTLELHEMKSAGTTMAMSPVKSIAIPAHAKVELKPGGLHLMLFGVKKPLAAGDTVKLTLTLDDGSRIAVAAEVRKPQGMQ